MYLSQTGHTYARGSIELNIYLPCSTCSLQLRAIQVLGTQGYLYGVAESPVEMIYRDARAFRIGEGTSEIQRNQIARALLDGKLQ